MMDSRQEYLDSDLVKDFCDYFTDLFCGDERFDHRFEVKWKRWAKHLRNSERAPGHAELVSRSERKVSGDGGKIRRPKIVQLHFKSVKEAYDTYFWPTNSLVTETDDASPEDDEGVSAGLTAAVAFDSGSNAMRLDELRKSLIGALKSSDQEKTFVASMKILDWGQVYKGSVGWLIQQLESEKLIQGINGAVGALDGDQLSSIKSFGTTWRMDSGLTKVYSLASKRSIIYDDRVAAALGLIVIQFLEKYPNHRNPGEGNKVPEELRFMVSAMASRNPSIRSKGFIFPRKEGGILHARSNLMANWILGRVARNIPTLWDETDPTKKLRMMESALFMLGYRAK